MSIEPYARRDSHIKRCAVAVLLALPLLATTAECQTAGAPNREGRDPVLEAPWATEAGKACVQLIGGLGPEELRSLKRNSTLGMAVFAAWESEFALVPLSSRFPELAIQEKNSAELFRDERPRLWTVAPAHLDRFIGFLEGRLQVEVPGWWQRQLFRNRFTRDGFGDWFPDEDSPDDKEVWRFEGLVLDRIVVETFDGTRLRREGDRVVVESDDNAVSIVFDEFEQHAFGQCATFFSDTTAFMAFPRSRSYSFPLVAVDRKSGGIRWRTSVWALAFGEYSPGGSGGKGWEGTAATVTGSASVVYVFGCDGAGIYIEGFDMMTGDPVLRFSSNYWFQKADFRKPRLLADEPTSKAAERVLKPSSPDDQGDKPAVEQTTEQCVNVPCLEKRGRRRSRRHRIRKR